MKTAFKYLVLVLGLAGAVFFVIQVPKNLNHSKLAEPAQGTVFGEQINLGLPVRLKIPTIQVDAAVESVGLASDGSMDVPKAPDNVGWFNLGPRPGQPGSSVIDGHFGVWKNGKPTVFNKLDKLQPGDKLYVEDETGLVIIFVVVSSRKFDPSADASDVFGSNDDKSRLNLITCDGTWDEAQKTYSQRLVVFTDRQ